MPADDIDSTAQNTLYLDLSYGNPLFLCLKASGVVVWQRAVMESAWQLPDDELSGQLGLRTLFQVLWCPRCGRFLVFGCN